MKPLRETEAQSPLMRQARALLESTEPLPESRERMLRVRRALDQRKRGGVLGRVPAAATAGVIVLFGASAFAAVRYIAERSAAEERASEHARVGHARMHARAPGAVPPAPVLAAEAVANAQPAAPRDATARRGELQDRLLPEARTTADKRPRAPARAARARNTARLHAPGIPTARTTSRSAPAAAALKAPELASATSSSAPATSKDAPLVEPARIEEPVAPVAPVAPIAPVAPLAPIAKDGELVHRALQALRRQDDPALAARLLAQHRQKQPSGALAEEALSLQIEAAVALEDPRALMFAREYLARYPHGRYVRVARKALAGGR